jgi:microcystin degradation protein MlrC
VPAPDRSRRRIGVLGLWHETNTYATRATTLADFEAFELLEGDAIFERNAGTESVVGGFLDDTAHELVPLLSAGAWPGGIVEARTIGVLLERAEKSLRGVGRLDGILLNLHGAMVAEGVADPEAALLEVVRETHGDLPAVAVLDLHANPSVRLAEACDAIVSYDTYPHVDMRERGREAAMLLNELLEGRPLRTALGKVPLLACPLAQATGGEPMASLQEFARQVGDARGLRRVCVVGGFAYSDVERAGTSVLVVHAPNDGERAREAVRTIVDEIERRAGEFEVVRPGPAEAVRNALAAERTPVVLADVGDNIGGGSPGDGTALLAELLAQRAEGAVVVIADGEVARQAAELGEGGGIEAAVGGKFDGLHGQPVRVSGTVRRLSDGNYRAHGTWMGGRDFAMGQTAVVDVDGVTLVVTERPVPPFHVEQLTSVGVDPGSAHVIVAKGAVAWRSAYGDIAAEVIEVATPGICPVDVSSLPRATTPMRIRP